MFSLFSKKYTLQDLFSISNSIKIIRDNYRIALIDDQTIPLIKTLKLHSYRIDHFKDVEKVEELDKYHIVVCDIDGVGKAFGSKFQGGHLIKEIRNQFPLKYIIAFSGKSFDIRYNDYFKLCDNVMEKYADATDWTNCLDLGIKQLNNPVYVWNKARNLLLLNDISLIDVAKIEQCYIKSVVKADRNFFDRLEIKNSNYSNAASVISAIGTYIQVIIGLIQLSK
jgi:hypothetical protein